MQQIYLDYNATTPIDPEVQDAILPFLSHHFGNPSSSYALGRACHQALEVARGQLASLINADPDEVYFTSGGTESNNLVIQGTFLKEENRNKKFITSSFEHPATLEPAKLLQQQGIKVEYVECDSSGVVNPKSIANVIDEQTALVSIMHANNEIGTLQPIKEIAEICHSLGALFHTDTAQSLGKVPVDVEEFEIDFLSVAGHKLYAPKGIGAVYIRNGVELAPLVRGAGQESGVRPGTENVPYIAGLGVAAKIALREQAQDHSSRLRRLRDRLEAKLKNEIPELIINGANAPRLPNTSNLTFPKVSAAEIIKRLPELCFSVGAACHSGSNNLSATLRSIGLTEVQGASTIRISLGRFTTEAEIEQSINLLLAAWEALS